MNSPMPHLDSVDMALLLEQLPVGVSIQDDRGGIIWVNSTLVRMLGVPGDKILGRAQDSLPLARSEHQTGEGELFQLADMVEGGAEWLACIVKPWLSGGLEMATVTYYLDVSDAENARIKVDRLTQALRGQTSTDFATGLLNKKAALAQLETQVSRSRRYHNLLSVVLLRLRRQGGGAESLSKPMVVALSRLLRDQTRWPDIIARWGESEFLLVLPETSADSARLLADKIRAQIPGLPTAERELGAQRAAAFGIAEWTKGDDSAALVRRAVEMSAEKVPVN